MSLSNHTGFLRATLSKCIKSLIAERDCFYDSCANPVNGEVEDPGDKAELADMDSLIDDMQLVEKLIEKELGGKSS